MLSEYLVFGQTKRKVHSVFGSTKCRMGFAFSVKIKHFTFGCSKCKVGFTFGQTK